MKKKIAFISELGIWRSYIIAAISAIIIALFIRWFVLEAYRIPSSVMKPTLEPGDVIFVIKWPFGLRMPRAERPFIKGRSPRYGEVVIYTSSVGGIYDSVRRVVGLPGDSIGVSQGRLVFNGQQVPFTPDSSGSCGQELHPKTDPYSICLEPPLMMDHPQEIVPEGSVFVLVDNRRAEDLQQPLVGVTRSHALVQNEELKAKASRIWLSIDPYSAKTGFLRFPKLRTDRFLKKIN